ncbi:multicopper oxidase domain-containing protein [Bacillus sp. FJAT-53060]
MIQRGDYTSIRVINHLPEVTSIHWHRLMFLM